MMRPIKSYFWFHVYCLVLVTNSFVIPKRTTRIQQLTTSKKPWIDLSSTNCDRVEPDQIQETTNMDALIPQDQNMESKESTAMTIEAPSVAKILKFAVPAIGVWLCSPLLSLIDTSAVGLLSGTAQQAALNPAVTVSEYTALLIAFMYNGSTNLVARAKEKDRGGNNDSTSKTFIAALKLSGFVGLFLGSALLVLSIPLLKLIIGNDTLEAEVFTAALKYVRIRALGMPAAAIIGTSQAACLGLQDIKSPLYVLLASAIVNFFGDLCFVGRQNPWIGGTAGAAWATVISQYAAVAFFVRWMCGDATSNLVEKAKEHPPARGFLHTKFRARDFLKLPSRKEVSEFAPFFIPVTSTQCGRLSSYVSMSHTISSALDTTSMAAQQVIISVWNCLYPIGESLSSTAQSFIPSIMEAPIDDNKRRAKVLFKTLINFWKTAFIFGSISAAAVLCIPFLNPVFTSDTTVMALVNSVVPLLLVIFSTLGIFTSSEGMLLGQKDLGFLGKSYGMFFCIVPYFMLRLKRMALSGERVVTLRSVWSIFACYQIFRTIMWTARTLYLQNRIVRDEK